MTGASKWPEAGGVKTVSGWLIRHDGGRHKGDNVDTVLETDFKGQSHWILNYILAS
jgi:hypothetical protein